MTDKPDNADAPAESAQDSASAGDILGAALGGAARKAGINPDEHENTGQLAWAAIGGWRGMAESVLPTLAFIITYTLTQGEGFDKLWPALVVSVGAAAIFTIIRLVSKQPIGAALGGLVGAAIAAGIALWTGNAADTFVIGLLTNIAYGLGILISVLVGWSAIGLVAGFLMGDATAWRRSKHKRRVFFWLGIAWAGLFFLRFAVQFPVYLQSKADGASDESVALLGTLKIAMGIPLFAIMIAITWFVVRRLYYRPVGDVVAIDGLANGTSAEADELEVTSVDIGTNDDNGATDNEVSDRSRD